MGLLGGKGSARLLIVGDELSDRELLGRWLRDEGYLCTSAGSPAAAHTRLLEDEFGVVLVDIRTLGDAGPDVSRRIEEISPATSVLGVAEETDPPEAVRAAARGAYAYLSKPFGREEALALVRVGLLQRRICLGMNRLIRRSSGSERSHERVIRRLTRATGYRDEETGGHVERSGIFSGLLAAAAGWEAAQVELMRLAAPLHDIGKIGIPDAVLLKRGKLEPREVFAMQAHTLLGFRMFTGSANPALRMAREVALAHHERWDGRGYPLGLTGPAIPAPARVVAIVDVFDALTHDRPYRKALPGPEVMRLMREGRGTHFDPRLLDVFLALLAELQAAPRAGTGEGKPAAGGE